MMALIEDELGTALYPRVRRKPNTTRPLCSANHLCAKAKRVVSGTPEVMVKVTGFGKGAAHVKAHLDYVSRNGKLDLENDRGEVFTGKDEIKDLFNDWKRDFDGSRRRQNQRDTMHLVLSMPEGTDPEAIRAAAREFSKTTFGENHEYVFALHTDQPHPHVHVTVKTLGFNGRRLRIGRDTAQEWREGFAEAMRNQGVESEATPRCSRGLVRKPESQVIRHIERGDKSHKPRVSRVRAAKVREVATDLLAEASGQPVRACPWEGKIRALQKRIRAAWLNAAAALGQSASSDDRSLAAGIRGFVEAMPDIDTERHDIRRMLFQRFGKHREKHVESPVQNRVHGQKNDSYPIVLQQNEKDLER